MRVGIIGAGRLGASLAAALIEAGYRLDAVASRSPESAARLAHELGRPAIPSSAEAVVEGCDLVFLAVPDAAVGEVAASLPWLRGQGVVHCSGALPLDALGPAASRDAACGCLHPLQSFPSRAGDASRLRGITCGIEAGGELSAALEAMAERIGARAIRLEGVDRAAYHAAAVFVSNYVVALMAAAREAWTLAGLPSEGARPALAPLLTGAADNVARHDLDEALTGPIARGDEGTVRRHLEVLGDTELAALYRGLGAELLTIGLPHDGRITALLRDALAPPATTPDALGASSPPGAR